VRRNEPCPDCDGRLLSEGYVHTEVTAKRYRRLKCKGCGTVWRRIEYGVLERNKMNLLSAGIERIKQASDDVDEQQIASAVWRAAKDIVTHCASPCCDECDMTAEESAYVYFTSGAFDDHAGRTHIDACEVRRLLVSEYGVDPALIARDDGFTPQEISVRSASVARL
jgi:hypothetical protein